MTTKQTLGVIGAGAWGTALAQMLSSAKISGEESRDVLLWAFEPEVVEAINKTHRNPHYLPNAALSKSIRATGDLGDFAGIDIVLAVTPAQVLGRVLEGLAKAPRDLVLCSKGIEAGTGRLMNDVARAQVPGSEIAVLSGPTFAHEVASGLPTAVTLACEGARAQWERLSPEIARPTFRPYYSHDVTGAEIGGSIKNVLAIACGVIEGLGLGQNARASLIARGYAEMLRFGEALGAEAETLAGLCGLGDLVLTCSSTASRNFSLGKALGESGGQSGGQSGGEGKSASELMADRTTVAEGAHTAPVLAQLAETRGIAMPIVTAVNAILEGAPAPQVVAQLLARPLTAELSGASQKMDS